MTNDPADSANRLAGEKSPYLQQHAHNPVDWYPWGEEAFEEARKSDRPIFLSIGYATCHWCHVMAHESFEDPAIATLMNRYFVNVKVDREERPDVDRVYMAYVQAATGSGGWPMSVWLTPDLAPLLGGTYFPPRAQPGMPGFRDLLERVHQAWTQERDRIKTGAARTLGLLEQALTSHAAPDEAGIGALDAGLDWFRRQFDRERGGFGAAPKFPRASTFGFLFRQYARTGDPEAAEMVLTTLREMARGGIRDHVGGGFHRYSVDGSWHVPHFEKMLYDQAQLVRSYLEAHQITGEAGFAEVATEVLEYVLRDLTDPETGAFYSAEDADSALRPGGGKKAEGAFYVWTLEELREVLGDLAWTVADHFGVRPEGNAVDPHGELRGKNVLHATGSVARTAARLGRPVDEVERELTAGLERLAVARARRPRPLRDEKVLTAWNGMMISALARAHQVLGQERYLRAAERAAGFVRQALYDDDRGLLRRRWCAGEAAGDAFLEDYAQLVEGLLDLYEAGFDAQWLRWAEQLTERAVERFHDDEAGGFFATAAGDERLPLRLKDDHDGAEPAGNSVLVTVLLRLGAMLDRGDFEALARRTLRFFGATLKSRPQSLPHMLSAQDLLLGGAAQVVLAGRRDEEATRRLVRAVHSAYVPNRVMVLVDEQFVRQFNGEVPAELAAHLPPEQASAHVCRAARCLAPTADPQELLEQLVPVRLAGNGREDAA